MQEKIEKLDLFKFFQEFFNRTKTSKYDLIDDKVKIGHSFMLKRYLSIKHPELIQMFNRIDSATSIDAIRNAVVKPTDTKSPGWMYLYTKANKSGKTDPLESIKKFSKETVMHFKRKYDINDEELSIHIDLLFEETIAELNELEEQLNKKTKPKKR